MYGKKPRPQASRTQRDTERQREKEGHRGRQRESTSGVEESQWQSRQYITTHQCTVVTFQLGMWKYIMTLS